MFLHIQKIEEQTGCDKILKVGSLILLAISLILVVALAFVLSNDDFKYYAENIEIMCINNHT